ncbi:hypothetical protein GCM10023189_31840 [Nibrella saemangeumensis]|uniref:starch synthase n=1 Tax=Nibrella saemangeumensis TaxID=1084526 RepID=A0ABP8N2J6_9BACT
MKIIFYSPNFYPMIGGLENVVKDLAIELSHLGHKVRVITSTKSDRKDYFPFEVIRGTSFVSTVKHMLWAQVVIQTNVSLKGFIPILLSRKLFVVNHQGEYNTSINGQLKRIVARKFAINVSCSSYIARNYENCEVILNPYNPKIFYTINSYDRPRDLVFLGRLVSEKGGDVLLHSLKVLKDEHALRPSVTIVGEGPEEGNLKNLSNELGLSSQITFTGNVLGEKLARLLNQHKVMVVPSAYAEPFGIVALEGIACGCLVVGSDAGGLPEAIGPCGVTFPMGDVSALSLLLAKSLYEPFWREHFQHNANIHLQKHTRSVVAERLLSVIRKFDYGRD